MTQEECKEAGLKPDVRGLYFRTDDGKANLAPPSEGAHWFHLVSVDLGNATGLGLGPTVPIRKRPIVNLAGLARASDYGTRADGP
jgi:hypothetical protein